VGQLLRGCRGRGWRTQIETNGTLSPRRLGGPDCWPDDFNVSPKLAMGISRGADPESKRVRPKAIADLLATGRAVWKFVAAEIDDLDEILPGHTLSQWGTLQPDGAGQTDPVHKRL
jgi:7-carboxy-7-deazaguanine synthase